MDYLIIGILFFVGNAIWSIAFLFYQSYAKKKGENIALKEDSKEIAMLTELGKNMATKSDIREITLIAERTKNEATRESAQRISYETEKGKNLATKEDIEEITKGMEIIKNEISFENQRKHSYIEQRTNRFIEILHLAEELQLYKNQLLYYLYDKYSVEKLSILINDANKTLLKLNHKNRLLMVSIDDEYTIKRINNLVNSSQQYVAFICYIASNAISHLSDWKTFFDLANQNQNNSALSKMAIDSMEQLQGTRNEFENDIKEKEEKLYDDMVKYLAALKRLFRQEFYLKFDFVNQTDKPEH